MPRPGGSTHSTTTKPSHARGFTFRYVGGRWQVKQGEVWRNASEGNLVGLPLVVLQPNGTIVGQGVVSRTGKVFRVTA